MILTYAHALIRALYVTPKGNQGFLQPHLAVGSVARPSVILPFVTCSDQSVVVDQLGLESLLPLQIEELQGLLCNVTYFACDNQSFVGDHIVQYSLLPHLIQELQGSFLHPTLSACTDQSAIGDNILDSLQPHQHREQQGPHCYHTLSACADQKVVGDRNMLESLPTHQ